MQNASLLAMFESFHLSMKSKEFRQAVSGSRVVEVDYLGLHYLGFTPLRLSSA